MTSAAQVLPAIDGRAVAQGWLDQLSAALGRVDAAAVGNLFRTDGYWRDLVALTWDLQTFQGPEGIAQGLAPVLGVRRPVRLVLTDDRPEVFERKCWGWSIEGFFEFETDVGRCRGHLRLLQDLDGSGTWKAWTVVTSLEELKGFEEHTGHHRPRGHVTRDKRTAERNPEPDVLVVGAGHAGLTIAARLKQLDVETVVVESYPRIGDNWRTRYQSLVLHNEVWANHLPYLPFPSSWPVYITKDQLADWLEHYASILDLDVMTSTRLVGGEYDDASGRWTVGLVGPAGKTENLRPRHVILATGVFGPVNRPEISGSEDFRGVLTHAADYRGAVDAEGRRVLVVGSGSSAHDVAQDLCENGAEVTMLQRSSTCVVSVDPGAARAYAIYREDGPPVEACDLISNSFPLPLVAILHKDMTERIAELDADLLAGLRAAGFALDFGEDGSGFLMKYHRYGGGYYINVGASELIIEGRISIKQGVEVERMTETSAVFTDGTSLEVDMVVIAAGYKNMSETVRGLFGDEVADRVGPVWGLDAQGEVRGMWRPTGQPGLWIMGGSLQQCRPYSKYLALEIKGQLLGLVGSLD